MYLSKIKISNYKSFRESELLEFEPGINIIIGQNNSGKTALLEALELRFDHHPHRDIRNIAASHSIENELSTVDIGLSFDKGDILKVVNESNIGTTSADHESVLSDFNQWMNQPGIKELFVENYSKNNNDNQKFSVDGCLKEIKSYTLPGDFESRSSRKNPMNPFFVNNENEVDAKKDSVKYDFTYTLEEALLDSFKSKIYRFSAQRSHTGTCSPGDSLYLKPDASNLAEVISQIQLRGRQPIYNQFNHYLNSILPDIKMVSARIKPSELLSVNDEKQLEVLVWSPEADGEDREDLALELQNCGTGVSQLIAILYVVVTTVEPAIIIIDEPQSFLHPKAVRQLIEIFKEVSRHQYIIATHSPQIISAVGTANIIQLSRQKSETITQTIDPTQTIQLRSLLKELGVSLSDVFGADVILWVEGATEEIFFPLILDQIDNLNLGGIKILGVVNTGDFEARKHARTVFDIYDKLSNSSYLLPPALGFIFDSENRSKQQILEMQKRHPNVDFLSRCNYENYLIHPIAIATVLNQLNSDQESITDVKIQDWITKVKEEGKFLPKDFNLDSNSEISWIKKVDGAKLLKTLFSELSQQQIEYRKMEHSVAITNWLINNDISHLSELSKFLKEIIQKWSDNCDSIKT